MKGSYSYKIKTEARKLYIEHDWSLKEIANKYDLKEVSYSLVPRWMREQKAAYEIARAKRIKKQAALMAKYKKRYEKQYKAFQKQRDKDRAILKPKEAERVKKMVKPFEASTALTRVRELKSKQTAGDKWLSGVMK